MKPPDIVAATRERKDKKAVLLEFDTLHRDRLPPGAFDIELVLPDHPVSLPDRAVIVNAKVSRWVLIAYSLIAFLVAPVARSQSPWLFSPFSYPVLCLFSGIAAYICLGNTGSARAAGWMFFAPQALGVFLEWTFSPAISGRWVTIPVVITAVSMAFLADQVNTHYVHLITANIWLKQEAVEWRRRMWSLRFKGRAISREIATLEAYAEQLQTDGSVEDAALVRGRAEGLRELREYPVGFLATVYSTALLFLGVPTLLLVLSSLAISGYLAFRRPLIRRNLGWLITEVIGRSFVSCFLGTRCRCGCKRQGCSATASIGQ